VTIPRAAIITAIARAAFGIFSGPLTFLGLLVLRITLFAALWVRDYTLISVGAIIGTIPPGLASYHFYCEWEKTQETMNWQIAMGCIVICLVIGTAGGLATLKRLPWK